MVAGENSAGDTRRVKSSVGIHHVQGNTTMRGMRMMCYNHNVVNRDPGMCTELSLQFLGKTESTVDESQRLKK